MFDQVLDTPLIVKPILTLRSVVDVQSDSTYTFDIETNPHSRIVL